MNIKNLLLCIILMSTFQFITYAQLNSNNYINLGDERFALKDYVGAIANYTKAINVEPNNQTAYSKRALCYNYIGEYDKAESDIKKSTSFSNQSDISFHKTKAENYAVMGLLKKAIKSYSKLISIEPENTNWYIERAKLYIKKKDYKSTIKNCDWALNIKFNSAEGYYYKALAYIAMHDYEQAIINLNFAISIRSNYVEAYGARGFSKIMLDDYPGASADWQSAGDWGSKYRDDVQVIEQSKRIINKGKKGKDAIKDQQLTEDEKAAIEQQPNR